MVLEHLSQIRAAVDGLRDDMRDIGRRLGVLEENDARLSRRLDRLEERVERIDRRLDAQYETAREHYLRRQPAELKSSQERYPSRDSLYDRHEPR